MAEEFGLHPLAVEDAVQAHQRPKLERYGDTLFVVLRPARYLDRSETVAFGEVALSGEVRPVAHAALRLKEAAKLGRKAVLMRFKSGDQTRFVAVQLKKS